ASMGARGLTGRFQGFPGDRAEWVGLGAPGKQRVHPQPYRFRLLSLLRAPPPVLSNQDLQRRDFEVMLNVINLFRGLGQGVRGVNLGQVTST
ncbi:MAG: hypothetical protein ACPIOQ_66455, partial [Promethearchaeia archaeon]